MKHVVLTVSETIEKLKKGEEVVSGGIPYKLIDNKIFRVVNKLNPVEITPNIESFARMHHCFSNTVEYNTSIFDLEDGKEYCASGESITYRRNGSNIEYMCNGAWKRASFHAGVPMFAPA